MAEEDTTEDTTEDTETTEETEWVAPGKQDWDNLQLALKKARQDARAAKRDGKPEVKTEDVEAAALEKVEAKYKPMLVRQAARSAFVEAGLLLPKGKSDAVIARVMRLLDHDELEVDDNGDVTGLDEQIGDIKADFPELFVRRGSQRVDGADKGDTVNAKKSAAQILADQLTGGR